MSVDSISFPDEIWKKINEWENYSISNYGRVFSKRKNILLKTSLTGNGYQAVSLCNKKKSQMFRTHRLLMSAFYGHSDLHVDHIDGNKLNNHISNLEYVSLYVNILRFRSRRRVKGFYVTKYGVYVAQISYMGKNKQLGRFDTEKEAVECYQKAFQKRKQEIYQDYIFNGGFQ